MDADLALSLGFVIGFLAIPAIFSALSDRRSLRGPALMLAVAAALMVYAVFTKPGGYALADIPDAFFGVVARFIP